MKPIYGVVELENGLVLNWLRFAPSNEEAIRLVKAAYIYVVRCEITPQ